MTTDLNAIRIERVGGMWRTWIPASKPEHRDTDGESDLGIYGNTYFDTFPEAIAFLAMTACADMLQTGWEPKHLEPKPKPTPCCQCVERFPVSPPAATVLAPRVASCPMPDHPERPWTYQFVPICDGCKSDWWGVGDADRPPNPPPFMALSDEAPWVGC
jgi:hypothetical protein